MKINEPDADDEEEKVPDTTCRLELWRCLSGSIESVVKTMHSKSSLLELTQNLLAKIVFHGSHHSMWDSLMSVSSARSAVRCVKQHDHCVLHNILQKHVRKTRSNE